MSIFLSSKKVCLLAFSLTLSFFSIFLNYFFTFNFVLDSLHIIEIKSAFKLAEISLNWMTWERHGFTKQRGNTERPEACLQSKPSQILPAGPVTQNRSSAWLFVNPQHCEATAKWCFLSSALWRSQRLFLEQGYNLYQSRTMCICRQCWEEAVMKIRGQRDGLRGKLIWLV